MILPPALIFYTDNLPEGVGGCANAFVVRIKTKYREDMGILNHELCHVWQWWFTLGVGGILYRFSRAYRLWAEAQAYRVQMRYPPAMTLDDAAQRLMSPRYNLNLTLDEAKTHLEDT